MEIITFNNLVSTNITAMELAAAGASHGTVIHAIEQTGGKGRLGREWISIPGKSLSASLIVCPKLPVSDFSKITLVAGVAISEFLDREYSLSTKLKWPNDIYFSGKKLGGILSEAGGLNGVSPYVVVGVGLNIGQKKQDFDKKINDKATSLSLLLKRNIEITELLEKLFTAVINDLSQIEKIGFSTCFKKWRNRDMLFGKKVKMVSSDRKKVFGEAIGINDDGILLVRDDEGVEREVISGDLALLEE